MKTVVSLLAAIFIASVSLAQQVENYEARKEKMQSIKIAFITQKLALTTEEAQKFWPIYNEMESEMDVIQGKKRELMKENKGNDNLSENEYKKIISSMISFEEQELAIRKKYSEKFLSVLPAKKVFELEKADREFRREMLSKMRENKGDRARNNNSMKREQHYRD